MEPGGQGQYVSARHLTAGSLNVDLKDARVTLDGETVRLGLRAFALLVVLMARPQILVTKEELFNQVWKGLHVSDAVLTTAMKELRQALGDDARRPRFIETAHGRGYRFLMPVERVEQVRDTPEVSTQTPRLAPGRRRLILTSLLLLVLIVAGWVVLDPPRLLAVAGPHPKSIVILPFEDLSPDGDQQWFADGLGEEVQARLARTPDLRLVSRVMAARMSQEGATGQEIAARLDTAQFLEGSVRRSGDRVRVTVKLVRGDDGTQIWSHIYDRDARDVITIQEDIALRIASSLKTVMDPEQLRIMVDAGTQSVEAHEAYLRGLALDQKQLREGDLSYARAAAEAYEQARQLDPQFAAAHWKAAQTWFGNQTRIDEPNRALTPYPVRLARYLERVDAAILTSRDRTERLKYRAARASMDLDFRAAHSLMSRYLRARPRDIDAWEAMADLAAYAGETASMRRAAERIHRLSLEAGEPRSRAITVSVMAMDLGPAVERSRVQLALRPDSAVTQYQAHRAFIWTGKFAEAKDLMPTIQSSGLPANIKALAEMRQACAEGRTAEARAIRARIDLTGELGSRARAASIVGDRAGATAILRTLDKPQELPALMQFMIDPTFNAADFPLLASRLAENRVKPRRPVAEPYACSFGAP